MASGDAPDVYVSFLGTGWSFPPRFVGSGVQMSVDEQDIHESLQVLFGTAAGERFLRPDFGLAMHDLMFEPITTTLRTFLVDRMRTAILVYEPRIKVDALDIASPDPDAGTLQISLTYEVRSTNSRFNLVYPFYRTDGNELRASVAGLATRA